MSTELAVREQGQIALADPEAEVEWASRCAKALVKAINGNPQLKVGISGRDYIKVEGWQTLGAMTKIDHVEVVWCREYTPPGGSQPIGWEARVEVRDRDGNVRGTGEAMCVRTETNWKSRDEFALRSMAQTRAMGKAYRMALSYVVSLAGYEATPAEEMPQFTPTHTKSQPEQSQFRAPESVAELPEDEPRGLPTDGGDPSLVEIHFGKNTGKRLGDITAKSREWYAETWQPDGKYGIKPQDRRLRVAARILAGLPVEETAGVFRVADDSNVPF